MVICAVACGGMEIVMEKRKLNKWYVILVAVCVAGAVCGADFNARNKNESIVAFKQQSPVSAEEHAQELLRALYGNRVTFRSVAGDGSDFLMRYYCSNVCIDACADGSVRYLCDIRAAQGEDPLLAWLFGQEAVVLLHSEAQFGMEYRKMQSANCSAEVCLNLQTGRVFAAKIKFNS